jgi:hypothetical protein
LSAKEICCSVGGEVADLVVVVVEEVVEDEAKA